LDKDTYDVDALIACDTDFSALRAKVDTNDAHGRGVFEQEMASERF
jgi:hypothetical protein